MKVEKKQMQENVTYKRALNDWILLVINVKNNKNINVFRPEIKLGNKIYI